MVNEISRNVADLKIREAECDPTVTLICSTETSDM